MDEGSSGQGGGARSDSGLVTAFINYRKAEAAGWARLLYDRLAAEFGDENVFLDQVTLEAGVEWLRGIQSRSSSCSAFIALVGPRWASSLAKRAEGGEEDFVRSEIEAALDRGSGVQQVIPALVEGATIPAKEDLRYVGSVKPLLSHQQAELRPSHWDADVAVLIERLKRSAAAEDERPEASRLAMREPLANEPPPPEPPIAQPVDATPPAASRPGRGHYEELAHLMLEEGSLVVPFLGSGTNSSDRSEPWRDLDSSYLPDASELADYLAKQLGMKPSPANLALVSQSLSVAKGPGDLYMALRRALPPHRQCGSVHRFLAGFPAAMHAAGASDRYQLIVTTNYDNALEQAFEEEGEACDLAVYIARGRDKGKFVHVPHDGEPRIVVNPNEYADFPIDAFGRVERTVIMKVHGAVDRPQGPHAWRDNYVITEDDYIDYMSDGEIESIVPQQLLGKLRTYSHFLFLGHEMHDWSPRVFLIRIFGDRGQPNTSWAVQREPSRLDERFWQRMGVDLVAISLDEYVKELGEHLTQAAAQEAQA